MAEETRTQEDKGEKLGNSNLPGSHNSGEAPNSGCQVRPDNSDGSEIDLDWVLINELGQFGRFQLTNLLLVVFAVISHTFLSEYIFSAAAVPHRCRIPECGETGGASYELAPEWILNAVPGSNGDPDSCMRYAPAGGNGSLTYCPATIFNQDITRECDGFVYERTNSVVYEFDLGCQEWMRALAGTLSSIGILLALPISGYVSDKYGRRVALSISVFNLALFGLIRSFSVNYPMYLAFQIIQTTLGAGTFTAAYIFATELVGPKYRVTISFSCSAAFAIGNIAMGGLAWLVQPWRYFIMTLYIPCFLMVGYYWLLTESVRWLLSRGKFAEARVALEKVAKVNRTVISEKSMQALLTPSPAKEVQMNNSDGLIRTIFKSPILLRRVCTTPILYIATTFVFYGLNINSTGLPGNMYANYMLVSAVEIPAIYTSMVVMDRLGRKATLVFGFFVSAACNIAFTFIDTNELVTLGLVLFLMGKFGISTVFPALNLYTSELYPTQFRHTLLGFSSMIGRIGSITAPLTPALAVYWAGIPSVMFGTMGLVAGALVLTQPETLGCKMPDTLQEAEDVGRQKKTNTAAP